MTTEKQTLTQNQISVLGAQAFHHDMLNQCMVRSCWNCEHMIEETITCELAGSTPPLKVIIFGCPAWKAHLPF
jgi:hypothetical protein